MAGKKRHSTAIKKSLFLKTLEKTLGVKKDACKLLKIPERTLFNWLRDDSTFVEDVGAIKEVALDFVESKMFEKIAGYEHKDTWIGHFQGEIITKEYTKHYPPSDILIRYYLGTQGKHRGYIERTELDVNPQVKIVVEYQDEAIMKVG